MKQDSHNALLQCLVIYTKLYHTPFTMEAITAGLPVEEGKRGPEAFSLDSSKSVFSRAANNAGLVTRLVKKELEEISTLTLPVILLLRDQKACILEELDFENNKAMIVDPEIGEGEKWVGMETLKESYLGYTFLISKKYGYEVKNKETLKRDTKHWFWDIINMSKGIYIDVLKASFAINLFVIAAPLFTMNVYDRVVPNNATETLWVLAFGVVFIYVFDAILKFLRTYFIELAAKKSDIILSSKIFEQILDFKMSNAPKSVGSFASVVKEFDSIRNFLTSSTVTVLIDLPFSIIFLAVIAYIGGKIVLIPITFIVIILLYTLVIRSPLYESIKETYIANANKNSILIESLNALETIKMLGSSGYTQWKWEEATADIANKSVKSKILSTSINTITSFFMQMSIVFIVAYGVYLIRDLELTMGGLIAIVILSSRTLAPVGQIAALISNYEQTKTAYESINEVMNQEIERPKGKDFIERKDFRGKIEFRNVTFSYPQSDKTAIENVSLKIEPGEKVALLGKNGSGKTTIEKMILSFYEPDEGSILIDDIDIKQIDPLFLRRNISYVPQNIVLFSGTLKENIIYKAPYSNDDTIINAAKISGVDQYAKKEPKGYDVYVSERGDSLSGGQKQSVGIARAMLLDLPLVIMDEPTNSMDSSVEKMVIKNLKEALVDKTFILTTHRNNLLELVDRVIIIDSGRVVFDGPKEKITQQMM